MYRRVETLDFWMGVLAGFFPQVCTAFTMPHPSVQGRPIKGVHIHAGSSTSRHAFLIIGGMHARELMNPDAIAELQQDLVLAYVNNTGITYGGKSWLAADIRSMLETSDIWMVPCANPDGREYCFDVDDMWRPNRHPNPGIMCSGTMNDGSIDVNRNCDIVWGVVTGNTSCDPCNETYLGPNRFSEPESQNLRDFCNTHNVDVFLDVHSFSELVLFPWGHAPTQTTNPSQRFPSLATGTCAPLNPPGHQEYMLPGDQQYFKGVAQTIVNDIRAVRGRIYTPKAINQLYAVTGSSSDYVYSRHIANSALYKTYGFSFETGPPAGSAAESFHPADPTLIKRDTKAGIISLLFQPPLVPCALELFLATAAGNESGLEKMRAVRDEQLATTDAGRELITLFERIQFPLLDLILADEALTREAMDLLEISIKLIGQEETVLSTREMERGLKFVDSLASRATSKDLLSDLETVRKQLEVSAEKSFPKILDGLLSTSSRAVSKKSTKPRPKK